MWEQLCAKGLAGQAAVSACQARVALAAAAHRPQEQPHTSQQLLPGLAGPPHPTVPDAAETNFSFA